MEHPQTRIHPNRVPQNCHTVVPTSAIEVEGLCATVSYTVATANLSVFFFFLASSWKVEEQLPRQEADVVQLDAQSAGLGVLDGPCLGLVWCLVRVLTRSVHKVTTTMEGIARF